MSLGINNNLATHFTTSFTQTWAFLVKSICKRFIFNIISLGKLGQFRIIELFYNDPETARCYMKYIPMWA